MVYGSGKHTHGLVVRLCEHIQMIHDVSNIRLPDRRAVDVPTPLKEVCTQRLTYYKPSWATSYLLKGESTR